MAHRQDVRKDCRPMDLPVPSCRQPRRYPRFPTSRRLRIERQQGSSSRRHCANSDDKSPRVFCMDGDRSYPAAILELQAEGRLDQHSRFRRRRYANNRIESDHRQVKWRPWVMQAPRTLRTARRMIQGIEAVQMIRKGQGLGITTNESRRSRNGLRIPLGCHVAAT